jgi:hypothetical protein
LRQGAALDVLDGSKLLCHALAVLARDRSHTLFCKLLTNGNVVPKINLCADDKTGNSGAVMVDLGKPFLAHVFKGGRRRDREADEEHIGLRIRERPQTVIVLLPGGVEETKCVGFVADPK